MTEPNAGLIRLNHIRARRYTSVNCPRATSCTVLTQATLHGCYIGTFIYISRTHPHGRRSIFFILNILICECCAGATDRCQRKEPSKVEVQLYTRVYSFISSECAEER